MEDRQITSEQSIDIITRMIAQTRQKFERGGGSIFLIWGYTSLIVSALVFVLLRVTENPQLNWLWFLIPIIGWPTMYFYIRKRERPITTQIDKFISYVWLTVGLVAILTPFFSRQTLMTEGLVLNIGVVITGAMIAFRPLIVGGIIGILLSYSISLIDYQWHIPIFAAMFVVTMIIPGHILNHRGRCSKN